MARFEELDMYGVERTDFFRALVIYQHSRERSVPALEWMMTTAPGGRIIKLDEDSCNKVLNGVLTDTVGFAASASHVPLVTRARNHLLRIIDVLWKASPGLSELDLLSKAREGVQGAEHGVLFVGIAARAAKAMSGPRAASLYDALIADCSTGRVFFPDAVFRLRHLCFGDKSCLKISPRPTKDELDPLGFRGGCGVRYFSRVVKYYRRPTEASGMAFFPGQGAGRGGGRAFTWVVGPQDDDWVNTDIEFGIFLEKPARVKFQEGRAGISSERTLHVKAFQESDALVLRRSGIVSICERGNREAPIPSLFYGKDYRELLSLLGVAGTSVRVRASNHDVVFALNDSPVARIPLGGARLGRAPPCGFMRFGSPRAEWVLSAHAPSFASTHEKKVSLLSHLNLCRNPRKMNGVKNLIGKPGLADACPMFVDNLLSYGRSAGKELECAMRLSRACEDLAGSMFRPCIRQLISHPMPARDVPGGLYTPVNFENCDTEEKNAVIIYESAYPSVDKRLGYDILLQNRSVMSSFVRDVALMGEVCRRAGVIHNDMHGRNILWRSQPSPGSPLLTLIDMDRSEAVDDPDLAGRGVVKDVCTYIIESLCSALWEHGNKPLDPGSMSMFGDINVAMSMCLGVGSVFWARPNPKGAGLILDTSFDVVEKWNPRPDEAPPEDRCLWFDYYTSKKGQNFRIKPSYICDRCIGERECSELLNNLLRISCTS